MATERALIGANKVIIMIWWKILQIYFQVLFSPICIAACIFVSGAVFEAKSPSQIVSHYIQYKMMVWQRCSSIAPNTHGNHSPQIKDTRELGTQLWLSEWFIWPPAQFVNFYFLPTKYRVVYDNLVSLFYDWYTSHLKHSRATVERPLREDSQPIEGQSEGLKEVLWRRLGPSVLGHNDENSPDL